MMQSGGSRLCLAAVAVVAVVVAPLRGANGQIIGLGKCPAQAVVQGFDVGRYLGTWYEYSNYFAFFEFGGSCITATYTDMGPGKIGVFNRQKDLLGKETVIEGQAVLADPTGNEAKLLVSFNGAPSFGGGSNYWVLDTDYDTYSIVWSCSDFGIGNAQILWILTRQQFPDQATVNNAVNIIRQRGLNVDKLEQTNHQNC